MIRTRAQSAGIASAVALAAFVLVVGSMPDRSRAADHLDAPGLTSPGGRNDADINNVYAFQGANRENTVLAMTTHPLLGPVSTPNYATDVRYKLNIDRNGDAVEDLAYVFDFGPVSGGTQAYKVTLFRGKNAQTLKHGRVLGTGTRDRATKLKDDGRAFAGKRSDPFFFDLSAFLDVVVHPDPTSPHARGFCDGHQTDFFSNFNTNGIVLEVPTEELLGENDEDGDEHDGDHDRNERDGDHDRNERGTTIGVWGSTIGPSGQIDRMGRPAINTVFNVGQAKNAFNAGKPSTDRASFSAAFVARLHALSGGRYSSDTEQAIVNILLPDMLVYDTAKAVAGPLNGRKLSDDVIDVELNLVTGGGLVQGTGAIPSDCVGAHSDYKAVFPYLGDPH